MITELWTEKYRPTTLDGYVFKNKHQEYQIRKWVEEKSIPSLLFTGIQGGGKTTLAKILVKELDVHPYDYLELNASRFNSVEDMRTKVVNFVQMIPYGDYKVVFLDEFDMVSVQGQALLRNVFETYYQTARFILTGNYAQRIIPAIHSRCQGFHIDTLDQNEFLERVASILIDENIDFTLDVLESYVKLTYPDLRKCINLLQQNTINSKLQHPSSDDSSIEDYKLQMMEMFKKGNIREARKLVCSQIRPDEIEDVYRWLYNNLDLISDDENKQEQAILIIKQGLVDHTVISDPEINLAAVMIKLSKL